MPSQRSVPVPKDVIGFTPGDDFKLASWAQFVDYFTKLDAHSRHRFVRRRKDNQIIIINKTVGKSD